MDLRHFLSPLLLSMFLELNTCTWRTASTVSTGIHCHSARVKYAHLFPYQPHLLLYRRGISRNLNLGYLTPYLNFTITGADLTPTTASSREVTAITFFSYMQLVYHTMNDFFCLAIIITIICVCTVIDVCVGLCCLCKQDTFFNC